MFFVSVAFFVGLMGLPCSTLALRSFDLPKPGRSVSLGALPTFWGSVPFFASIFPFLVPGSSF